MSDLVEEKCERLLGQLDAYRRKTDAQLAEIDELQARVNALKLERGPLAIDVYAKRISAWQSQQGLTYFKDEQVRAMLEAVL